VAQPALLECAVDHLWVIILCLGDPSEALIQIVSGVVSQGDLRLLEEVLQPVQICGTHAHPLLPGALGVQDTH
jgi:hypothetical protein